MNKKIEELFRRYESGEANKQERELVEIWFRKYDKVPVKLNERIFKDLDKRIDILLGAKPKVFRINSFIKLAAALLIFTIATLLTFNKADINIFKQKEITYTLIEANKGRRKEIKLIDGTSVTLNAGTTIQVPSDFGEIDRKLILAGEAYFVVKRDTNRRFIIQSGELQTIVLGTTFSIKAYPEEKTQLVTVTSGKVKVEANYNFKNTAKFSKQLTRNKQLIFFEDNSEMPTIHVVDADRITSWKNNILNFDQLNIEEIAILMERWYDIPIEIIGPNYASRKFTISFRNEPIHKVLHIFSELSGFTCQINNNRVIINTQNM